MVAMTIGENLSLILSKVAGAIVQGHEMFVVGGVPEDACVTTARIEHPCKVRHSMDLMG